MSAPENRLFLRLTALYFAAAGIYAFSSDATWEAIRSIVPDSVLAFLFFLCGPIISTDFIAFFSAWPFIFETLIVLLVLSLYTKTGQVRYLGVLVGVWFAALPIHSALMGRLA